MARGSGLEGRLVTLDKLSQMDVGQGGAEERAMSEAADRGGLSTHPRNPTGTRPPSKLQDYPGMEVLIPAMRR